MAQLMTIQLSKGDSPNLGFRLQGGKDFAAPLVIQKVNGGSPAERAGLIAGDAVIKINSTDVFNLRHKDAQDVIIKAGPSFTVTVQRGGSTWKPAVTPTGHNPVLGASINNISPVTQTSLAAQPQPSIGAIGTGHNLSAKPFLNGTANGGPKLVNKQYNSPVGLYSEQSIAETLSAQSEVLSTGVLGVNFKKNEKGYDASKSAVYHMLQEAEKEPRDSEPEHQESSGVVTAPLGGLVGLKHVQAPETKPQQPQAQLPPGQNICADCERLIVGVFVRIKDKNLHVECFKCSTCGASLKNVGYYNINNKLYCDIHAKLAAKNNPPAPNLVPVTIPPGGKAPVGTISAALASHSFPSPGPQSPKTGPLSPSTNITATPFQPEQLDHNENVKAERDDIDVKLLKSLTIAASKKSNANLDQLPITEKEFSNTKPSYLTSSSIRPAPISHNQSYNKGVSNFSSAPRPFSSVSAPLSPNSFSKPLPRSLPAAPAPHAQVSTPGFLTAKPSGGKPKVPKVQNIVWPPIQDVVELPTASPLYFPPPSQIQLPEKVYEAEERDYTELEDYNNFLEKEKMDHKMSLCSSEVCNLTGRKSAMECVETIQEHLETQMLVESVMKGRPKTPPPLDVDPIPPVKETKPEPKPEQKSEGILTQVCPCNKSCCNQTCDSCPCKDPPDLKRPNDYTKPPPQSKITNAVPQKYESPLVSALKTTPDKPYTLTQIPQKHSSTPLASALSIAPSEPFNPIQPFITREPVPLPEETVPYLPPEHPMFLPEKVVKKEVPKSQSPFVEALKIAPDRPFTPVGGTQKKKVKEDPLLKDLPKPQERISMLAALTTAPDRSYSPFPAEIAGGAVGRCEEECKKKKVEPCYNKPSFKQPVPQPFVCAMVNTYEGAEVGINPNFPPVSQELQQEMHHADYKDIKQEIEAQIVEQRKLGQQEGQIMYEAHVGQNRQNLVGQESRMEQMSLQESQMRMEQVRQEYQEVRQEECRMSQARQEESRTSQVKQERFVSQQESQMRQQTQQVVAQIAKQSEEIIMKKPMNLASSLHKSEYLPQYQTSLEFDEEIQLPHHKNINKLLQQQKPKIVPDTRPLRPQTQTPPPQITKPVRTLEGGYNPTNPQASFQPVTEEFHPPKAAMGQRVGQPGTPSLINKPPSAIPYYQQNLVATEYLAPESNLFDPKSPAVSRSPSPCPGRERSPSPFPSKPRAKSPAPGPPPNPLSVNKVSQEGIIPDVKVERAKESLSCYIPQHREKLEMIKKFEGGDYGGGSVAGRTETRSEVNEGNFQRKDYGVQEFRGEESQRFVAYQEGNLNVSVSEKAKLQEEKQLNQMEMKSVESSGDGRVVQRRKVVKEEFEHTHKEKTIEIEKTHPFQKVNAPVIEDHQGIIGLHVTNPHPLNSPFFNKPQGPPLQPPQPPKRTNPPQTPAAPAKTPIVPSKLNVPVVPSISCGDNVKPNVPVAPPVGSSGRQQGGSVFAPKRGRGVLNVGGIGARIAQCGHCHQQIRGPFITALGKIWCPEHFTCATPSCKRPLQDIGFVEERGQLHCEYCFEQYLAPNCSKCNIKIKGDCLKAIGKNFHPECFNCAYCGKLFANSPFFLEDGLPYCETDWNEMFTTKCFACGFPVEAGDRWVEALNNNYHSQCFNCTMCKKNLEGQSFFAKGGRPFCKNHAR